MTKLRYVGPHVAVEVPALETVVKRGEEVEVEDAALAASLLDQEVWEPVAATKKAEKKAGEDGN